MQHVFKYYYKNIKKKQVKLDSNENMSYAIIKIMW